LFSINHPLGTSLIASLGVCEVVGVLEEFPGVVEDGHRTGLVVTFKASTGPQIVYKLTTLSAAMK
jgi:hypothetical protein